MKKISLTVVFILFLGTFCLSIIVLPNSVSAKTLFVGGSGPGNYSSIQKAIYAAEVGDTVHVYSGTYYEHLLVFKTLNLTGEDRNTTIIDGSGAGVVVHVIADWTNISGFTVTNSGIGERNAGIYLNSVQNCSILNNTLSSNPRWGVSLQFSDYNTFTDNSVSNSDRGFFLLYSNSSTLSRNIVSGNYYGINIFGSYNNIISNTVVSDCMWGIRLGKSNYNAIINNNASSIVNQGVELWHSDGNTVANNSLWDNGNGVFLTSSNNNTFVDNTPSGNKYGGFQLRTSNGNELTNNNVQKNEYGILNAGSCWDVDNWPNCGNDIVDNHISLNDYGLFSIKSNNSIFIRNHVSNNMVGIHLEKSNNHSLYHNSIVDNALQASDDENTNQWDDGYPSGGNYWSDYSGVDLNNGPTQDIPGSDGIGDTPYDIDYDSMDRFPLTEPFGQLPVKTLSLDIDPDTLNIRSGGKWITAYLTTENAMAEDIDPSSLLLNDFLKPEWWTIQNKTILMVKFDRTALQAILLMSDSVAIKITGLWMDGKSFEVHDTIRVIDPVSQKLARQSFASRKVIVSTFQKNAGSSALSNSKFHHFL